jgi:hypothetical protein
MDFEPFDSTSPVRGETQIRTVGLRVSSYATDSDGIPVMTASSRHILLPALQAKAAFDSGLRGVNETEQANLEPLPVFQEAPKTLSSGGGISSQSDDLHPDRPESHIDRVTILLPFPAKSDGRSRRRKYASRADQQRAYRERKAALQNESTL